MGRQLLKYAGGLIGLYLVVYYGTNSGNVIRAAANGAATDVKAFQGRAAR